MKTNGPNGTGSVFASEGSMLTAIDVEHPTVQQALNTDEGFQCSS